MPDDNEKRGRRAMTQEEKEYCSSMRYLSAKDNNLTIEMSRQRLAEHINNVKYRYRKPDGK